MARSRTRSRCTRRGCRSASQRAAACSRTRSRSTRGDPSSSSSSESRSRHSKASHSRQRGRKRSRRSRQRRDRASPGAASGELKKKAEPGDAERDGVTDRVEANIRVSGDSDQLSVAENSSTAVVSAKAVSEPVIRRAAALRVKYRVILGNEGIRVPPEQIGMHPKNRDGAGPSGERCSQLLRDILHMGYDPPEANAGGVLVQEHPTIPYILPFNKKYTDGDDSLADVVEASLKYGSLAHGHLAQVFRNIHFAIASDVDMLLDERGRLSVARLRSVDPAWADDVVSGCRWEILSHQLDVEEPEGATIIQSAMNAKNSMFLIQHEMQALGRMTTLTSASAFAEVARTWQLVQGKLRETLPEFADDENFLGTYSWLVDLGSGKSVYVRELRGFHDKFINPMKRRVRLSAFAVANLAPMDKPRTKIAVMKWTYVNGKVVGTYCTSIPVRTMKALFATSGARALSDLAEEMLEWFRVQASSVLAEQPRTALIKFLGNVDVALFNVLFTACGNNNDPSGPQWQTTLATCAEHHYRRLDTLARGGSGLQFPWKTMLMAAGQSQPASELQPKVIEYDSTGKPVAEQDVQATLPLEEFAWDTFMGTSSVTNACELDIHRGLVGAACMQLHLQMPVVSRESLQVRRGGSSGKGVYVVASKLLEKDTLRLAPVLNPPMWSKINDKATGPGCLKVSVHSAAGESQDFFVVGAGVLPKSLPSAESAEIIRKHDWKIGMFPAPFWLIRRVEQESEANCKLLPVKVRHLMTFASAEQATLEASCVNFEVHLSILQNFKAVAADQELTVYWPSEKASKKSKSEPITKTWVHQARDIIRRGSKGSAQPR